MRIVVTGGAGYCGVPLCAALLVQGHSVTIVDSFFYGVESILHLVANPKFTVIQRDIRHSDRSYLKGQDAVFHLAAISGYPECETNSHSASQINVLATQEIVEALSPSQLMIFPSTTSFYGKLGNVSTEDTPPTPISLYGITKWKAELLVMQHANSISLRWPTVFGVSARMRSGLLVNDLTARAVRERAVVLYDPDSQRSFLHIYDLVRGYLFALEHSHQMTGGVFNVGSHELNFSKREVAECIQAQQPCEIIEAAMAGRDLRNFVVAFDKIAALGFETKVSLAEGVAELIKLYRFYVPYYSIPPV